MLSRHNPTVIETILQSERLDPPIPDVSDRAAWDEAREWLGPERAARLIAAAEEDAARPIPWLPATLYLDYQRTGRRGGYQDPAKRRREMLANLAVAECLEDHGRFLDPLLDVVWAICEESTWCWPAHEAQPGLADKARPTVDLGAARTAFALAECDHVLGARLDPLVGRRIRWEVDQRCLTPYLTRHDHRWLYTTPTYTVNNWTGVCHGGVIGAAVYLEQDTSRLAELLARALRALDDYLESFDAQGGASEGPSIWAFGFSHYTILADLVERRTGGRVSMWEEPVVRETAQFPLRTLLREGAYVNFSDTHRHGEQIASHLAFLSRRLELPDLMRLARASERDVPVRPELPWALRELFWRTAPEPAGGHVPARHDWFPEMMWMISRYDPQDPQALILAAKGGHNAEMHNQNDVGTFTVDWRGEALIADLGRPIFTAATRGANKERYRHLALSSLGHSVPLPNGQPQAAGRQYASQLLAHDHGAEADRLELDLSGAYPAGADLEMLVRRVVLHRVAPQGWVELEDRAQFATGPGSLSTVLMTYGEVSVGQGQVRIDGQRGALVVRYDQGQVDAHCETIPQVELWSGAADVRRIAFTWREPMVAGTIALRIEPV